MNETQARELALVQALESTDDPGWRADDRRWAGEAACADTGLDPRRLREEPASRGPWLSARATRVIERLRERSSPLPALLDRRSAPRWPVWLLPVLALLAGAALDALAGGTRLNLLSPPFLAILLWNGLTYLLLAAGALAGRSPPMPGWASRLAAGAPSTGDSPVAARFSELWRARADALHRARALGWLHLAAAAFAVGALVSLYWRGLGIEYRAGWESTFLDADQVHALLAVLLGPASLLSGLSLPDVQALAALHFARGPGENAAAWIHLLAITMTLYVIAPRLVLAGYQGWRARALARHLPWPVDDAAARASLPTLAPDGQAAEVLPYGWRPAPSSVQALVGALAGSASVLDPLQLGDEDDLPPAVRQAGSRLIVLFTLAATPEAEHHRRLLETLRDQTARPLIVLIDETSFHARFGGDPDRMEARRRAWREQLDGLVAPLFVRLDPAHGDALARALDGHGIPARRDALAEPVA